jgi:1-deoxyxylulose-5-phosphate synthase
VRYGTVDGVPGRVSRLVLGTMAFATERMPLVEELLGRFIEAGGTMVDTARVYGHGESERALGQWLKSNDSGVLKVLGKGATYTAEGQRNVNPAAITRELGESRDRLGVETIDLYLLHRDDPDAPVGPIVDCLHGHAEAGRIGAYGGSNWTPRRLEEANAYAAAHGLRPFVASSPNLALAVPNEPMWRECVYVTGDADAFDWYRRTRFPLFSWSSQASGFFTGRFSTDEVVDPNVARVYYRAENWERLRRVRELAEQKGATPTQVALAWVLHQPLNVFALIGPRSLPELDDCLGALAVELTPDEAAWLQLDPAAVAL